MRVNLYPESRCREYPGRIYIIRTPAGKYEVFFLKNTDIGDFKFKVLLRWSPILLDLQARSILFDLDELEDIREVYDVIDSLWTM